MATEIVVYEEGGQEKPTLADLLFQQALIELIENDQLPRDYCGDGLVIYPVPTGFGIVRQRALSKTS